MSIHPINKAQGAEKPRVPNIILILVDDMGYGDLSSYGAKDLKTPSVDALVSAGMRFDNFYANCPVCSPTRASLLSGRYPELVGVPGVIRTHATNNWGYLAPRAVMLPQVLKKSGYHTAIVGKWHLGLRSPNTPLDRGFDHFHGWLGDMMDDYYKHRRHGINYMRRGRETIDPKGHATDLFTEWAIDYLGTRKNRDGPWFLYLAYNAPHTPIQPPSDWVEKVKRREPGISDRRAKLVALIEHMDAGIDKVVDFVKKSGQADNTLIVFSSDNGGQLSVGANNGPLRGGKQEMYEGGLKVPTCVGLAGADQTGQPQHADGGHDGLIPHDCRGGRRESIARDRRRSILPTLLGKPQEEFRRDLFFTRREGGSRYGGKTIDAVRRGPWKLLQNSPWEPLELYNLADDPLEKVNLAVKNRRVFNELSAALREQIRRGGAVPWQRPDSP